MRAITFTLCLCLLFTQAYAGPFGTEMGDKPEKFGKTFNDLSPERGIRVTPPKQHSTFTIYELRFADDGLASVTALSDYYKRDRFASGAKSDYATLKKQLTEKYGQPQITEYLKSGGIYDKDSEFAASLYYKERFHFATWSNNLPDNLIEITLGIMGVSSDSVILGLVYKYKNHPNLEKSKEKIQQDAL